MIFAYRRVWRSGQIILSRTQGDSMKHDTNIQGDEPVTEPEPVGVGQELWDSIEGTGKVYADANGT